DLLQAQHLGHFATMKEAGLMRVAGPLSDQPDESMRGICVYQVGSIDEARRLAESDPAVQAGLFTIDVMTWRTAKGAMTFPFSSTSP
ncbi:MAG: YciI family protein, partial [Mycobacteriales bacterium]